MLAKDVAQRNSHIQLVEGKTVESFLLKLNIYTHDDPAIPLLDICPRGVCAQVHQEPRKMISIAALTIIIPQTGNI